MGNKTEVVRRKKPPGFREERQQKDPQIEANGPQEPGAGKKGNRDRGSMFRDHLREGEGGFLEGREKGVRSLIPAVGTQNRKK